MLGIIILVIVLAEAVLGQDKQISKQPENPKKRSDDEELIRYKFCGKMHVRDKFQCLAWVNVCSLCKRRNHFAATCSNKAQPNSRKRFSGNRRMVPGVNHGTDSSDEYISMLTIKKENNPEQYASMRINGRLETFLLDTGATVNVNRTLDQFFKKAVLVDKKIEKTNTTLIVGKTRLQVTNPKNLKKYSVEFMVVKENCKSVLGAKASLLVKLFQVIKRTYLLSSHYMKLFYQSSFSH